MQRQETKGGVVQLSIVLVEFDGAEMPQEGRTNDAHDGRQRPHKAQFVSQDRRADRFHAPHRSGPRTADGENLGEIPQLEHGEDGFECVAVDAHRRRDMDGGLRGGLFLLWSCSDLSPCATGRGSFGGCRFREAHSEGRMIHERIEGKSTRVDDYTRDGIPLLRFRARSGLGLARAAIRTGRRRVSGSVGWERQTAHPE